ncbi:MAG: glycosyltransferase [Gemmatimonadota bacterium]
MHLLAPGSAGGLETVVRSLAIGQHRRGIAVRVLSVVGAGEPEISLHLELTRAGIEVIRVPVPPRAYAHERAEILRHLQRIGPAIVHTHGYRADVIGGGVARKLRIPTVTTVHGFTGGGWKNRLYETLQCRAFRRCAGVVAVSRPLERRLLDLRIPASRMHLIQNAWDGGPSLLSPAAAREALGVPAEVFHVGWVGRLSREKGADILVESIARLPAMPLIVSVIGDGAEHASLEALAASRGIRDRIRWHGGMSNASRLFPGLDLFILSSRTEGTPMVLFEAMAARVPIIATSVGGVPDVIRPADGLLVPSESPEALARAILDVRGDPRAAAARAASARDRLDSDFALDPWLDRYQQVYHSAIALGNG